MKKKNVDRFFSLPELMQPGRPNPYEMLKTDTKGGKHPAKPSCNAEDQLTRMKRLNPGRTIPHEKIE